eukprot:gene26843-35205_t
MSNNQPKKPARSSTNKRSSIGDAIERIKQQKQQLDSKENENLDKELDDCYIEIEDEQDLNDSDIHLQVEGPPHQDNNPFSTDDVESKPKQGLSSNGSQSSWLDRVKEKRKSSIRRNSLSKSQSEKQGKVSKFPALADNKWSSTMAINKDDQYNIRHSGNPFPKESDDDAKPTIKPSHSNEFGYPPEFSNNTLNLTRNPSLESNIKEPSKSTSIDIHSAESVNGPEKRPNKFLDLTVEPGNPIYTMICFSDGWFMIAIFCHVGMFAVLLSVAQKVISSSQFFVILILSVLVPLLLLSARFCVKRKSRKGLKYKETLLPEDEKDDVPPKAVYMLCLACILEGLALAIFAATSSGYSSVLGSNGFYTQDTMIQALRFASITLLAFHRIARPSNRVDPMRTMMELEVVSICWDALDGSTIFELIDGQILSNASLDSAQFLMAFWYLSVGVRMTMLFLTMLPPLEYGYKQVLFQPLQMSKQPTVDRTMQGLRIRSLVIIIMSFAEFYAAGFRINLWSLGQLNSLQQEMCLKNILFLSSVYTAYSMRVNTLKRDWNDREIGFGFYYPDREKQIVWLRLGFIVVYIIQGVILSVILINVTTEHQNVWVDNSPRSFIFPRRNFIIFPGISVVFISVLLLINLYAARVPAIFYNYNNMASSGAITYQNAILSVNISILVIALLAGYWSISYMIFKKEFTSSPGNYNAIHDPTISMVAMSTQIEGALDVLSCTQLLALASLPLPGSMRGAVVLFSMLELINAAQSFGLQVILSGGHDDTPMDLVKWKAFLRMFRGLIDFGTFVLRVVLWIQYNAVSSVFLIKNLYNLLNTVAQVERSVGLERYPKQTLFTEFVSPSDWYGMSKESWRIATRNTLAAQARA